MTLHKPFNIKELSIHPIVNWKRVCGAIMRKLLPALYVTLFQHPRLTKARSLEATPWSNVLRNESANYFLLVELYFHKKNSIKGLFDTLLNI